MPLTLVGLGLWDENDVSLRGLEAARHADVVFVEGYTAFLGGADPARLAALVGKRVRTLSREEVEAPDELLALARTQEVALLVVGDSLTATTHTDLRLRARELGIETRVVHGASIATAVPGLLGLANYKFGRATTLVFPHGNYFPTSPYDVVKENADRGLHTLVLLDLRAEEPRPEGGAERARDSERAERRGNRLGVPPLRCMTAPEGAALLLRMERERGEGLFTDDSLVCAVARAGSPAPRVVAGPLRAVAAADLGPPLHTLVVPGKLHFVEEQALAAFAERLP